MKYVDEYRDATDVQRFLQALRQVVRRPWTIMEICGGQTHTLVKSGLERMLPPEVRLVHGPGCPVCVTPLELIDRALALAARPEVIFTSFGDMLRVPGSQQDLLSVKAAGGDVRIVYSPLDAVKLAQKHPEREVVFFAVGFETTAPANAMAVYHAQRLGLSNFSILAAHVLVPPAMAALLAAPNCQIQGFLAAGHVCAIMGYEEYLPLAERYRVPIVVTGFEPLDLLQGIYMTVELLERGAWGVENQYVRAVTRKGNQHAQRIMHEVFEVRERQWRGIGPIAQSGLGLRAAYAAYDAEQKFHVATIKANESPLCIAGQIMQGLARPPDCSAFGTQCSPEQPLGAPMVSSEGACAAYYQFRK
ncbi:hydrogenase formation protein HypD [Candidatus Viridilinea mediisalina]|uniref:Hydrogenase formation protein HypD n=1 Tax=Candidatus Viridilinea mediisalina TaxID=2024553 RepID=A0A2A6RJ79_9CHLR|nr:hydrogenase formation protein HypD [Candidatus Viridilinea mediisalina]PDW03184.1 hydrogenase formation protein HypD [Candidatus Viridilinea mediisalina]